MCVSAHKFYLYKTITWGKSRATQLSRGLRTVRFFAAFTFVTFGLYTQAGTYAHPLILWLDLLSYCGEVQYMEGAPS